MLMAIALPAGFRYLWDNICPSQAASRVSLAQSSRIPLARRRRAGRIERTGCSVYRGNAMLRILGSPKRLCNGLTRREMLVAGGLSLLGVGLSDYLRLSTAQANPTVPRPHSFGRAKSCILLYLYG